MAAVSLMPIASATPRQQTGACVGDSGVTVVVDFQDLGGGIHVMCAEGPVSSGLDALSRAGISYETAQRFPGFVCRIANQPANAPCVNASPASAYWGYWLAAPGGPWCYSTIGAGSRVPPRGTFEGWSFSLDKVAAAIPPPRFSPPASATSPPATLNRSDCVSAPAVVTTTAATSAPTTAATTTAAPTTTATPTTATTALATTGLATTAATLTTGTTTTTVPSSSTTTVAVDLGEDGGDGGSPLGFVISAAVVIGLATAGVVIVRRRRARA